MVFLSVGSLFLMPLFHGKGARPFKFKFELSDVRVHLNSSSSVAVAVDNVSLTWERGPRSVSSKKGRVVEKLNSVTGELSRTAPLLGSDLILPATLFRTGGDEGGRGGSKTSEFKLFDADAEGEEARLCMVTFELSTHAASASQPVLRTRLEVPLTSGLGSMSFALCSRMLSSSGGSTDDGCSNAGSDGVSNASEQVNHRDLDDAIAEAADAPAFAPPSEHQQVANSMEARWQEVYELERSKQDALTIEKLNRDLGDLIVDKQRLSEENLRLKSILRSSDAPKKELLERVAELEAEVTKLKREAAVNEEQLATSYQSVIRQLEVELEKVTSQRDDAVKAAVKANERRNILDALRKDNTKPLPLISDSDSRNGSTNAQTHAQQTNAGGSSTTAAPSSARSKPAITEVTPASQQKAKSLMVRTFSFGRDKNSGRTADGR